jgi:hypothetical protein
VRRGAKGAACDAPASPKRLARGRVSPKPRSGEGGFKVGRRRTINYADAARLCRLADGRVRLQVAIATVSDGKLTELRAISRQQRSGAAVVEAMDMDFSQALVAFAGWAVLSVPVSLLIGAFIGLGTKATDMQVAVRADR